MGNLLTIQTPSILLIYSKRPNTCKIAEKTIIDVRLLTAGGYDTHGI